MGNFCAGKHEKQQTSPSKDTYSRNFQLYSFLLKQSAIIQLIIGTYHCHQSQTLLSIVQKQYLDYNTQLRDYVDDAQEAIQSIIKQGKYLTTVPINKDCPYKRLQICLLPSYYSSQDQSNQYIKNFQIIAKQILEKSSQITIQLAHTTENSNGLPNQTLMGIFFTCLAEKLDSMKNQQQKEIQGSMTTSTNINTSDAESSRRRKNIKISIIGNDIKILNLARYQIVKLGQFQSLKTNSKSEGKGVC